MTERIRDLIARYGANAEASLCRANAFAQMGLFELAALCAESAELDSDAAFQLAAIHQAALS